MCVCIAAIFKNFKYRPPTWALLARLVDVAYIYICTCLYTYRHVTGYQAHTRGAGLCTQKVF